MKSGYLYVLVHPSDPDLYKVGITVLHPEKRLAQHNSQLDTLAGRIVKETGQKWELKTFIEVADPHWAERSFWGATGLTDMPGGVIEVYRLEWSYVEMGLEAAKKAGMRPPPKPPLFPVRNRDWMIAQLEGSGISMIGRYRGLVTFVEFQCEKGHVFKESPGRIVHNKSCPWCVDSELVERS